MIIFLDENYANPQVGFDAVTSSAQGAFEKLSRSFTAPSSGYLYVYVSNESTLNVNVHFDDMKITHSSNQSIIGADDYYPFGLTFNKHGQANSVSQKFLYNGVELNEKAKLYETTFRQYDAALGLFTRIDPLAEVVVDHSPYHFAFNNPVVHNDPLGLLGSRSISPGSGNHWSDQYQGIDEKRDQQKGKEGNTDRNKKTGEPDTNQNGANGKKNENDDKHETGSGQEVSLAQMLNILGISTGVLDNSWWIGQTSKGKIQVYSKAKFHGNQYTTNLGLLKKAGVIGLFVQVGHDGFNLAENPNYAGTFLQNTGLGIVSLAIPEVGAGVLIYEVGKSSVDQYNTAMDSAPVKDFFNNLQRNFDRWVNEHME